MKRIGFNTGRLCNILLFYGRSVKPIYCSPSQVTTLFSYSNVYDRCVYITLSGQIGQLFAESRDYTLQLFNCL